MVKKAGATVKDAAIKLKEEMTNKEEQCSSRNRNIKEAKITRIKQKQD